jgi:hypothetical protein
MLRPLLRELRARVAKPAEKPDKPRRRRVHGKSKEIEDDGEGNHVEEPPPKKSKHVKAKANAKK